MFSMLDVKRQTAISLKMQTSYVDQYSISARVVTFG